VVLTRQFRFPAYVNGHSGMLIEAPAGLLDQATPEDRIKAEVEEETGYRIDHVRKIFEAFMSPGSVTEKLYFFLAKYDTDSKASAGGATTLKERTSRSWSFLSKTPWQQSRAARSPTARPSCCCSTPISICLNRRERPHSYQ